MDSTKKVDMFNFPTAKIEGNNRLWVKIAETFRINTAEMCLFDTDSNHANTPWQHVHQGHQLSVVDNLDIKVHSPRVMHISVWNHRHWVAHLTVRQGMVEINDNYRIRGAVLETTQTAALDRNLSAAIRIELRGTGVAHRIDIRIPGSVWTTLFVFGPDLIAVRPNGQFFQERLERMCQHVSRKTLEFQRTQNNLSIVVSNHTGGSKLLKAVDAKEQSTQTEATTEFLTMAELKAAIEQVVAPLTAPLRHPWANAEAKVGEVVDSVAQELEGAQSIALQRAETESMASDWTNVVVPPKKNDDGKAAQVRKQNRKVFGILFEEYSRDPADADDESDED